MKTLLKIAIILFLLYDLSFPQFYADSTATYSILELMKIADEFAKQNNPEKGIHKIFTEEEINHIAELYYKCYDENPVGFQKYVGGEHEKWEKSFIENGKKKEEVRLRPWLEVYALRYQIANMYGIPFTEVIGIPAFLRCKYIQDKIDTMKSNSTVRKICFVFKIEDVLKGNKFFKIGDTLFINHIYPTLYEKGISYLIPVTTWYNAKNYNGEVSFSFLHDDYQSVTDGGIPPKTFPIENEIIKNVEYFGIQDTSWTDFKKYFKENYLIFE